MRVLLVANRGEIARRIAVSARRLGLRVVAVYEAADAGSRHAAEADLAVLVSSYLDPEAIVAAAIEAGADAVHPGYGFLSENPALASACESAGLTWVGPGAAAIELLGDKIRAKQAAVAAGVTVVPAVDLDAPGAEDFPLIVKAAAGGGGRGMRVVGSPAELAPALAAARREAAVAFGSEEVFAERYVASARHVEVQILGDAHGTVIHLGTRDCTLQRRHQKVVEEASADVAEELCEEAVALARAVGYVNAGTVEFIVDAARKQHYFLEMNTRLQVEHPVTEAVWGVDLVERQLRIAMGEPAGLPGEPRGHAIEVRVTAEDVAAGFLPAAGRIVGWELPEHTAFSVDARQPLRVDAGYGPGDAVTTNYDSLLAKLIVHAPTRPDALRALDAALARTAILGVRSNAGFLRALLAHPDVVADRLDTGLIERLDAAPGPPAAVGVRGAAEGAPPPDGAAEDVAGGPAPDAAPPSPLRPPLHPETVARAAAAAWLAALPAGGLWGRRDGWRLGAAPAAAYARFSVDGGVALPVRVDLRANCAPSSNTNSPLATDRGVLSNGAAGGRGVTGGGGGPAGGGAAGVGTVTSDGRRFSYALDGDDVWLAHEGWTWRAHTPSEEAAGGVADGDLRAPMPGQVLVVSAAEGDRVAAGDAVLVLESMKMELTLAAPLDGVVSGLAAAPGDRVTEGQLLARIQEEDEV